MYAVIRAGGRQYRVAPGDVIRLEKQSQPDGGNSKIEFADVLAVSAQDGQVTRPQGSGALVTGRVLEQGRGDKVLVFHFKRKKQYKKLAGHRQPFTAVRITEVAFDGQKFSAPDEMAAPRPKKTQPPISEKALEKAEMKRAAPAAKKSSKPKAGAKKTKSRSKGKKK